MFRETLSLVLAGLLVAPGLSAAPPQAVKGPTVREQVLEIALGSPVEVRLRSKQKLKGRMGEVSDEGFSVQHVKADKLETTKIAFSEVKSIKEVGQSKHSRAKMAGWIAVGVAGGLRSLQH